MELNIANSASLGQDTQREWRESMRQEAAREIEAISRLLQCQPNAAYQVVRALGMRLEQLACIVLSTDDEVQGEAELSARLFGALTDGKLTSARLN